MSNIQARENAVAKIRAGQRGIPVATINTHILVATIGSNAYSADSVADLEEIIMREHGVVEFTYSNDRAITRCETKFDYETATVDQIQAKHVNDITHCMASFRRMIDSKRERFFRETDGRKARRLRREYAETIDQYFRFYNMRERWLNRRPVVWS